MAGAVPGLRPGARAPHPARAAAPRPTVTIIYAARHDLVRPRATPPGSVTELVEVDGVPALIGPTVGAPHAGLAFRVGFADEPLARRGITHLVEHLALHSTGGADYHYNGSTGVEYTYFHMQGPAEDLTGFLAAVCASLRDLPTHRLAVEKDLLRAEATGRGPGPAESLSLRRHGARDYGMAGCPEWGLPAITADDLRSWVARYFTRQNAVLWLAGDPVPAGLRLDLPDGVRRPAPAPSSALPVTPAYFPGSTGLLAWDAEVPRTAASAVFAGVLERAMFRELRRERGVSYTARADHEPLGADRAVVTAVADAVAGKHDAVLAGFVEVLATLHAGRIDEAAVATVVKQRTRALRHAEDQGTRLPGQAVDLLAGRAVQSLDEALAEVRAVGPAAITEVAGAACATALLMSPGPDAAWAGFTAVPDGSTTTVTGTAHPGPAACLVLGDEGVSLVGPDLRLTVRFDDCALVRAWPDGARHLIGHDGTALTVEPTLYADAPAIVSHLDTPVPAAVRVDQPPRHPDEIAAPPPDPFPRRSGEPAPYDMVALESPQPAEVSPLPPPADVGGPRQVGPIARPGPRRPASSPASRSGRGLGLLTLAMSLPLTLAAVALVALLALSLAAGNHERVTTAVAMALGTLLAVASGRMVHRCLRRLYRR